MEYYKIEPLTALGIIFLSGYFGGRIANRLKFPRVTGYILAGILLSPSLFSIIPRELVTDRFAIITDIALAVIAYSIGGSLQLSRLKLLGKSIFWITISQALGAFFLTTALVAGLSRYVMGLPMSHALFWEAYLPMALIIGAISAATAPAAVLAIVHECRAKGPLTTTLLGVVALDDGIAIIFYAFASAAVIALGRGTGAISLYEVGARPVITILGAICLGAVFGFLLTRIVAYVKTKESLLVIILGSIFFCTGIAVRLGFSLLLANMMMGFLVINMGKHSPELFHSLEGIEEPIFVLFFTLAGAHFDLGVFKLAGPMAFIIILGRFTGKLLGTRLGAYLSYTPEAVKKYLGFGLLPKAGVTIGLVLLAQPLIKNPVMSEIMVNAVLGSVIINELIAPPLVKYALEKAGEDVKELSHES
ncbi:MAG TPA: sodium:proton antiporter [Proteobacteria bacterium]|nr:sodium:proton antiporter [Pseudomonadota bacterium]